jgi:hypothetical protein
MSFSHVDGATRRHRSWWREDKTARGGPPQWTIAELARDLGVAPVTLGKALREAGAPAGKKSKVYALIDSGAHDGMRYDPAAVRLWWAQRGKK